MPPVASAPLHRFALALTTTAVFLAPLAADAAPSDNASGHVVQPGETLSQIALDAGTSVDALVTLNGLDDPNALVAGQSLNLPASASVSSAPAQPATYTVADGDTLWAIAQQFGTTTDALVQVNKLDDGNHLSIGLVLTLPVGSAPVASAPVGTAPPSPAPAAAKPAATPLPASKRSLLVSYTVQSGETLSQIARQFNISADAIAQASSLTDPNKLSVGAVLKLPVPAKEHVVTQGETLRDIAAGEKVDLGALIDFNQIDDPGLIRVGQVVLLPVAATEQAAASAPPASGASLPTATPTAATQIAATTNAPDAPVAAAAPAAPAVPPRAAPAAVKPTPSASAAAPKATPTPTPKPVAPLVTVTPPPGAPTDGLVGAGLKLLGSPYVWGGSSPSGFDCSGFVWYVARQTGKQLTRGLFGQYNSGSHPAREDLKVGDLVFFQNTFAPGLSHNGIYIGNGQFVHAADETAGVTISSLNTAYWSSHWFGATRLP